MGHSLGMSGGQDSGELDLRIERNSQTTAAGIHFTHDTISAQATSITVTLSDGQTQTQSINSGTTSVDFPFTNVPAGEIDITVEVFGNGNVLLDSGAGTANVQPGVVASATVDAVPVQNGGNNAGPHLFFFGDPAAQNQIVREDGPFSAPTASVTETLPGTDVLGNFIEANLAFNSVTLQNTSPNQVLQTTGSLGSNPELVSIDEATNLVGPDVIQVTSTRYASATTDGGQLTFAVVDTGSNQDAAFSDSTNTATGVQIRQDPTLLGGLGAVFVLDSSHFVSAYGPINLTTATTTGVTSVTPVETATSAVFVPIAMDYDAQHTTLYVLGQNSSVFNEYGVFVIADGNLPTNFDTPDFTFTSGTATSLSTTAKLCLDIPANAHASAPASLVVFSTNGLPPVAIDSPAGLAGDQTDSLINVPTPAALSVIDISVDDDGTVVTPAFPHR
jgi:hypothetical protein